MIRTQCLFVKIGRQCMLVVLQSLRPSKSSSDIPSQYIYLCFENEVSKALHCNWSSRLAGCPQPLLRPLRPSHLWFSLKLQRVLKLNSAFYNFGKVWSILQQVCQVCNSLAEIRAWLAHCPVSSFKSLHHLLNIQYGLPVVVAQTHWKHEMLEFIFQLWKMNTELGDLSLDRSHACASSRFPQKADYHCEASHKWYIPAHQHFWRFSLQVLQNTVFVGQTRSRLSLDSSLSLMSSQKSRIWTASTVSISHATKYCIQTCLYN